ncbi:MAG: MFS transporter [Rhizobiales bacterium PAR1]|nr:MAG: MFS transporter [Rhizobiales bacterium PAR1]
MSDAVFSNPSVFYGWRIVAGAFVVAVFGWGLGFYGPPVYLHAVREARGWSIALTSTAVTMHYLCGALVVANLPKLYRRFGLATVTRIGSLSLALGLVGWAMAELPWQLFAATLLTGCGWVTLGAAAINAIIAPWFLRSRPKALSTAYNGASVGGIIFSPLWVALIEWLGFARAAILVGAVTVIVIWFLATWVVARTPDQLGQYPDGEAAAPAIAATPAAGSALPGKMLWRNGHFRTLAMGMALGLFAQIGLLAHLFSLIVPALGIGWAGIAAGLATASAIVGRTAFGWLMPIGADRRLWAAISYSIQILGIGVLFLSGLQSPVMILAGVLLFGFGIGNATSFPPLIAQVEFTKEDAARVVPLIVAMAQATYAFAPATFGLIREAWPSAIWPILLVAALIKALAIAAFLSSRWKAAT